MSVIYEPRPRYVVETAEVIRGYGVTPRLGPWVFEFAFGDLGAARNAADRLAQNNQHVRVLDRNNDKGNI